MSLIKALPSDAECEAAGCAADAGLFLQRLAKEGKALLGIDEKAFVASRRGEVRTPPAGRLVTSVTERGSLCRASLGSARLGPDFGKC